MALMPQAFSDLWYDFCYWVTSMAVTLGFSLRTEGARHVPASGPALLIANHQSFIDPVLAGLAARRHLHYLARKTLFEHWGLSWLMRSLNGVPVDQEGFARDGLRVILEQLQAGRAVLIFPEGNRTPHGGLQAFRPGVHLLIKRVAMPVIPVGIAGAFDVWPRHQALPTPSPLFCPRRSRGLGVSIGAALDSRQLADLPREQAMQELFDAVRQVQQRAEGLRRKT
jgi:1-acyl-sn-glycerol-3-phosphate acyltransferase